MRKVRFRMNYTERNKLWDKISVVVLMATIVEVFLYAVDLGYTTDFTWVANMQYVLNTTGVVLLVASIGTYIYAFRKNDTGKVIYATEFLVLAFLCPFLIYWYTRSGAPLNQINKKVLWIAVLVYYVIRVVVLSVKAYLNSSSHQLKKKKN